MAGMSRQRMSKILERCNIEFVWCGKEGPGGKRLVPLSEIDRKLRWLMESRRTADLYEQL